MLIRNGHLKYLYKNKVIYQKETSRKITEGNLQSLGAVYVACRYIQQHIGIFNNCI